MRSAVVDERDKPSMHRYDCALGCAICQGRRWIVHWSGHAMACPACSQDHVPLPGVHPHECALCERRGWRVHWSGHAVQCSGAAGPTDDHIDEV